MTKTEGILLGIALATIIGIRQQRIRSMLKTQGPGRTSRPKKGRRHTRISKRLILALVLALALTRGQAQTPGEVIRQAWGPKRSQPACGKQKSATTARKIGRNWTPIRQSNHEDRIGHANRHCHKSSNSAEHPRDTYNKRCNG